MNVDALSGVVCCFKICDSKEEKRQREGKDRQGQDHVRGPREGQLVRAPQNPAVKK